MAWDAVTRFALGIHSDALTAAALFLNDTLVYDAVLLALLLAGEGRRGKQLKVILAMAIAFVLGLAINLAMGVERPCSSVDGAVCPGLYSFPSLHCTLAFILMISFLNKRSFPLYMLFALFVALTRINLGVHVFRDVAGALIVALLSYNIACVAFRRWKDDG